MKLFASKYGTYRYCPGHTIGHFDTYCAFTGYRGYDADAECREAQGYVVFEIFNLSYAHTFGGHYFVKCHRRAYCGLDSCYGYVVTFEGVYNHLLVFFLLAFVDNGTTVALLEQVDAGHIVARQVGMGVVREIDAVVLSRSLMCIRLFDAFGFSNAEIRFFDSA